MSEVMAESIRAVVDTVYRSDSRRVLATLIRLLGDFDLAEEALHDAFAAAVAMRDGPAAGLDLIDDILNRGELKDYHLAHSARADLCRRLGRNQEARDSYRRALELARLDPERRFLERRLSELSH